MVVDTSILLAVFFNEKFGPWALDRLQEHADSLRMSTVNYAEALILIQDRQPQLFDEIHNAIRASSIRLSLRRQSRPRSLHPPVYGIH